MPPFAIIGFLTLGSEVNFWRHCCIYFAALALTILFTQKFLCHLFEEERLFFQTKQAFLAKSMYQKAFWAVENRLNFGPLRAVSSNQFSKSREIFVFLSNRDLTTSKYTGYEVQLRGTISFFFVNLHSRKYGALNMPLISARFWQVLSIEKK